MNKAIVVASTDKPVASKVLEFIKKIDISERVAIITDIEALHLYLKTNKPELLLLESNFWYEVTPRLVACIAAKHRSMHIAVFNYESLTQSEIVCFLQMGATSFLNLREENSVIIKSLQVILSGSPSIPPDIEQADIQYRLNVPDNVAFPPKEHDAFRFLALGNSAAVTAEKMGIIRETVCNYRQSIYHKLGIHSQDEILVHAIRLGIVGLDELSPVIDCCRKDIEKQNIKRKKELQK
ncbi:hypothetical protein FACS1894190_02350 [Spirochaetia bacterium]|nr:hypothetical protein FACS1894190_02350 [Spirochaetia bacterium]